MMEPAAGARPSPREALRSLRAIVSADGDQLTYRSLTLLWRKGMRNGNWSRLDVAEKALVRCALWVAKVRGSIRNMRLMVQVLSVLLRLIRNRRSRIVDAGNRRAQAILEQCRNGAFNWVPQLREWLHDPRYVWYLGLTQVNR